MLATLAEEEAQEEEGEEAAAAEENQGAMRSNGSEIGRRREPPRGRENARPTLQHRRRRVERLLLRPLICGVGSYLSFLVDIICHTYATRQAQVHTCPLKYTRLSNLLEVMYTVA